MWNEQQQVPFAYSNELMSTQNSPLEWVGFDDVSSIKMKAKYVIENNLGGAMIWALDMDDFTGTFCNQGEYPLLKAINYYLNPNLNIILPRYDSIWKLDNDLIETEDPKLENDFIIKKNNIFDASGFSSSNNIFGLIDNNVLQVYKFCQCKSNTHTIISSMNTNENYAHKVDCNHKRVYSISDPSPNVEEVMIDEKRRFNEFIKPEIKKKNQWLFKINSSSSRLIPNLSFLILVAFLFRLLF